MIYIFPKIHLNSMTNKTQKVIRSFMCYTLYQLVQLVGIIDTLAQKKHYQLPVPFFHPDIGPVSYNILIFPLTIWFFWDFCPLLYNLSSFRFFTEQLACCGSLVIFISNSSIRYKLGSCINQEIGITQRNFFCHPLCSYCISWLRLCWKSIFRQTIYIAFFICISISLSLRR